MQENANSKKDIHARIFRFIIGTFPLIRKIPKTVENIPIIRQTSSALTSIGANDQEADAAQSKNDFIAKYAIVKKETKETYYWLNVMYELQLLPVEENDNLQIQIAECKEILNVVSSIILSSKR